MTDSTAHLLTAAVFYVGTGVWAIAAYLWWRDTDGPK